MTTMSRRQALLLAPFGATLLGGAAFLAMLQRMRSGGFDPHAIGNPMLGRPMPSFTLPGLGSQPGFAAADVISAAAAGPVLLNFFTSTCVPCAIEADLLGTLAQQGLPVWGIAYKDTPGGADAFLHRFGNPYARLAADTDGMTAIDWGVYGVPESFLVDRRGIVRWHIAGGLTQANIERDLMPAVRAAG